MARVKDGSRNLLPSMMSGKSLHKFQNPPADYIYLNCGPVPGAAGDHIQLALAAEGADPFDPKYEVRPPDDPLHRMGAFLNTQYLYLIYPTEEGRAELMRVRTPESYFLHPLPMDYGWLAEHCRVEGAEVAVRRLDEGYVYEVAIPWSELNRLPHRAGERVRMSMMVQDGGMRNRLFWSAGRSAARETGLDFEPGWGGGWSNDTYWGFAPAHSRP
jgi:hypothetical protein